MLIKKTFFEAAQENIHAILYMQHFYKQRQAEIG